MPEDRQHLKQPLRPQRYDLPGRRPCPMPPGPRTWSVWACDGCRPHLCSRLSLEGAA